MMKGKQAILGAMLLASLAGCATLVDSDQQELTVRAIEDMREVGGVGCILSNKAGRWFVTAPGRVMVKRNFGDLQIECKKDAASSGFDTVASKVNNMGLWGNLIVSAGAGYYIDKRSGAGFDYPSTLTVILQRAPEPVVPTPPEPGSVLY